VLREAGTVKHEKKEKRMKEREREKNRKRESFKNHLFAEIPS
jgi:hypothetical protein